MQIKNSGSKKLFMGLFQNINSSGCYKKQEAGVEDAVEEVRSKRRGQQLGRGGLQRGTTSIAAAVPNFCSLLTPLVRLSRGRPRCYSPCAEHMMARILLIALRCHPPLHAPGCCSKVQGIVCFERPDLGDTDPRTC